MLTVFMQGVDTPLAVGIPEMPELHKGLPIEFPDGKYRPLSTLMYEENQYTLLSSEKEKEE